MRPQQPFALDSLLPLAPGPDWWGMLSLAWLALLALVHIGFAVAVGMHARGRATALVPAWLWVAATLACGPLVGAAYWFLHAPPTAVLNRQKERVPS